MSDKPVAFNYAEYKALKERARWIPCSEMYPPINKEVLVHQTILMPSTTIMYYCGNGRWDNQYGISYCLADDACWMPLPSPPEVHSEE